MLYQPLKGTYTMSKEQGTRTRRYKTPTRAVDSGSGEVEGNVEIDVVNEQVEQKDSKSSQAIYAFIVKLKKHATLYDAREITAKYASVYEPVELRGMWRINGRNTVQLTDCFIEILRVVKPLPTSNSRDFTIYMRFTNPKGATLNLTLSPQGIDEDTLASQFIKFGRLPEAEKSKRFLIEAIKELVRESTALVQLQADALGWYQLDNGSLVWLIANGVETPDGFLTEDLAPFVSPTFTSPGNGYYGSTVHQPDDTVMHILLEQLLPGGSTLITSLLGLSARIMTPILTDDIPGITPGMLRFTSEIIGPPRHGKSRLLNAILSLFGVKFEYNTGSLLNQHGGSDSKIGRLQLSAIMRFHLFSDFDHKVTPGHSLFEKIHNIRSETNNIYSDDTGGGVVGTQKGGMRARAKPVGALIRTSNYDHSDYSLRHDEVNIEARCCSFVWPKQPGTDSGYAKADDDISQLLEKNIIQVYAWGVAYRRWYMHMHMDTILNLVEDNMHKAKTLVHFYTVDNDTWLCDLHRNQCVELVLGLLMWVQFLRDMYATSFMIEWIEEQLEEVIKDRLKRCIYIATTSGKFSSENKLVDFVLASIRYLFVSQQCYVSSQRKELLLPKDTRYSLEKFGYRRVVRRGEKDNYESGRNEIAHLIQHKQHEECLAFDTTLLYDSLIREAERLHLDLPDKDNLVNQLIDAGIVIPGKDGKASYQVKVGGKNDRYYLIAVNTIYPTSQTNDVTSNEIEDEDILEHNHEQDDKIVPFNASRSSLEDIISNM